MRTERRKLPSNCQVRVVASAFDNAVSQWLNMLDDKKKLLAPSFVMVDPFGVSDTPMDAIARILQNQRCEVYISFMYEAINRFKGSYEFEQPLDRLFGTKDWRDGIGIQDPQARKDFFYRLYKEQLRAAGAKNVVHLELYEGNRLVYAIFFGTQHWKGADIMKRAIWKVAPFGDYSFRGTHSNQLTLGLDSTDYTHLGEQIKSSSKIRIGLTSSRSMSCRVRMNNAGHRWQKDSQVNTITLQVGLPRLRWFFWPSSDCDWTSQTFRHSQRSDAQPPRLLCE